MNEDKFHKRSKIRDDDMIYNIKQLLRLQKVREQKMLKNSIQPPEMMEYLKKKNEIQILLENSKKIKNLQLVASSIELEIQKQNEKINIILAKLLDKFNLAEMAKSLGVI